jgi:8-oxo-dGTP pyrophosphatase MutT (NUDIX family)
MAEAKFYRSLHGRNKGLFYRGAKRPGAGGGSDLGALGRGLYLTWDRNMAQFFADRNRGQVYTYKIPGNLKLLDAQSQEMADIKATMGFKPWEYSDSSMYAAIVTNEAKALGYDGVISEKVADGLVLFEPRKAKLVTEASASKDRMLLLKRSGAVLEPGTWGIPGGAIGIDGDGNYEDAWKSALREASEEAGGVRGSPKGKFVFRDGSFTYTTFFVEAAKEFAPRLNWESSDWAWVTREEALGMRLHPGVRKLMKSRAASGRDRDLELHLYDFDGTLFRSPLRPDWWGKRSWWVESESLGPPCVPLKPGSGWWIGSTVRAAKKSIADPNVWAILCTGRADTGSLRYRVAELLKQQGLGFDEVYLAKGGQDAPSMYKVNVMAKILSRYPNIATVQIWEDTNLSRYVRYIESTGRTCIPHPVKVAPHEVDCTEEDMARMVEEGWSKWRKQP